MHFIAYGGGDVRLGDTLPIDKKVICDHGLTNPRIMLIAAGLHNDLSYKESFIQYVKNELKGDVLLLDLELEPKSEDVIQGMYASSDVIYIGPGDTRHLMNCIESNNFDNWLIKAMKEDKLIIGLSAGSNILFKVGIHDQKTVSGSIMCSPMKGLGFMQFCYSPHYNNDAYQEAILDYISDNEERGIVCDEGAAFEIKDMTYRCHSFLKGHNVRLLYTEREELIEEELLANTAYSSIMFLMD